jgi:hypothetical protein
MRITLLNHDLSTLKSITFDNGKKTITFTSEDYESLSADEKAENIGEGTVGWVTVGTDNDGDETTIAKVIEKLSTTRLEIPPSCSKDHGLHAAPAGYNELPGFPDWSNTILAKEHKHINFIGGYPPRGREIVTGKITVFMLGKKTSFDL